MKMRCVKYRAKEAFSQKKFLTNDLDAIDLNRFLSKSTYLPNYLFACLYHMTLSDRKANAESFTEKYQNVPVV